MEPFSSSSSRRCTFADPPSELIVPIAEWLPKKNLRRLDVTGDPISGPIQRISADLANLSVVNQRVRALLAERVIFQRMDLTKTTYTGLEEILEHQGWLANVLTIECPIVVANALNLYPGRTAHEYDAILATVIGRACNLVEIALNMKPSVSFATVPAAERVHLTATLRLISRQNNIARIIIKRAHSAIDHAYIIGMLQTWPQADNVRSIAIHGIPDTLEKRLPSFAHLWQTVASFPRVRNFTGDIDFCLIVEVSSRQGPLSFP